MTENIGKHLFEISKWGSAYYRGVVVKETEHSFMFLSSGKHERRTLKTGRDVLVDGGADPTAALARFNAVSNAHEAECKRLEDAARSARHAQLKAAIDALSAQP